MDFIEVQVQDLHSCSESSMQACTAALAAACHSSSPVRESCKMTKDLLAEALNLRQFVCKGLGSTFQGIIHLSDLNTNLLLLSLKQPTDQK